MVVGDIERHVVRIHGSWRSWRASAHNLCLVLMQPFGQTHSTERARLGCSCNGCGRRWKSWWRSRTRRQNTKERTIRDVLTNTSRDGMNVEHNEWRATHFTSSQCVPTLEICGWCSVVFARDNCACVRVQWSGSVNRKMTRTWRTCGVEKSRLWRLHLRNCWKESLDMVMTYWTADHTRYPSSPASHYDLLIT